LNEAKRLIDQLLPEEMHTRAGLHIRGRVLATAGEIARALGDLRGSGRLLRGAVRHQLQHRHEGYLGRLTYPYLAKRERTRRRAQQWLNKAAEIQLRNGHKLGHALTLLLQVRCGTEGDAGTLRQQVELYQQEVPALRDCPLLGRILEHWDAWRGGELLAGQGDSFWGL
jgi:hypothetical protein